MRKITVMTVILSILVCFQGCGRNMEEGEKKQIDGRHWDIDSVKANKIMMELWDAIEKGDTESVEAMLSQKAKEEIENYEDRILEFLDAFGSGIVAVRPHGYTGSFKSREYGETTCYKIYADYWVETEKGIFRLNFDCVIKNEAAPEEVGIYRIFLAPKEDDESGKYSGAGGSEFYICVFPFED